MPPVESSGGSRWSRIRAAVAGEIDDADLARAVSSGCPALNVMLPSRCRRRRCSSTVRCGRRRRMPQGVRWNFHIDAKRMRGFVGSIARSIGAGGIVEEEHRCHVFRRRSCGRLRARRLARTRGRCAATYTRSGSRGSTTMRRSDACRRARGGARSRRRRSSGTRRRRMSVLAQLRFAAADVDDVRIGRRHGDRADRRDVDLPSVTFVQVAPPLVVFHTPPFTAPK